MFFAIPAFGSIFLPYQGGTGSGVTPASGTIPIGNGTGTYTPAFLQGSGGITITNASGSVTINQGSVAVPATTTINNVTGPTFTVTLVSTSSQSSITTTTAQLFLNLLYYSSSSQITVTTTGTILFASNNISQFTNDSGYLKVAPATSTLIAGNTATGPAITLATTTASGKFNWNCTNSTCTQTLPSNIGFFTNDAGYVTSTGGNPGGVDTNIQLNSGGIFYGTSTLTFSSSTNRLTLNQPTSSIFIGSNTDFATSSASSSVVTTFSFSGAVASWTVPTGVNSLVINVQGAMGGDGGQGTPGKGGVSTGTLSTSAGTLLWINVGGQGDKGNRTAAGGGTNGAGFGGGGQGDGAASGAGGGGMSWVSTTSTFTTSTVIIVGAGGGGASGGSPGGDGGGTTGSSGSNTGGTCANATGGSQTAGGAGGTSTGGTSGGAGSAGQGGTGASNGGQDGSGGGGGFFGGGGGTAHNSDCAGSGAGGSSFATSTNLTATTTSAGLNNSTGTISFTYIQPVVSIFSTSSAALYVGGHVFTGNQNLATSSVSSCGTNPGISGNDTAGTVFMGSGVPSSCKVTFGQRFSNTPACVLTPIGSLISFGISSESTSSFTASFSAGFINGQFNYWCSDY